METISTIFEHEYYLMINIQELIRQSRWFESEPMPDGQWRLTVKDEGYIFKR